MKTNEIIAIYHARETRAAELSAARRRIAEIQSGITLQADYDSWRAANPDTPAWHCPRYGCSHDSRGPVSHFGRHPETYLADAQAQHDALAAQPLPAYEGLTLHQYIALVAVAHGEGAPLDLAIRLGLLPEIAPHISDAGDEYHWQGLWEAHANAGHALPDYERDTAEDSYPGGDGDYQVPYVTTTWSALGECHEICICGDYGLCVSSQGRGRHDEWDTDEDSTGCTTSPMVAGLVLAHGDDLDADGPAEPTIDDIDTSARPHGVETLHGIQAGPDRALGVIEITLSHWQHPYGDRAHAPTVWIADCLGDDDTYDTRGACRAAIRQWLAEQESAHIDGPWITDGGEKPTLYEGEDDAEDALRAYLTRQILAEVPDPQDLEAIADDDTIALRPDDTEDADDLYHLDLDDLRAVYAALSYDPVLDTVADAFGRRAVLADLRARQAKADAILAQQPETVWVTLTHSTAAGNCPYGTADFVTRLRATLGNAGEIGAARADVILTHRDDAYTRRACRLAALGQQ